MRILTWEDIDGNIRCIMWPEQFAQYEEAVVADEVVVARGALDRRGGGDEANLIINELVPLDQLDSRFTGEVVIHVSQERHGDRGLDQLKEILRGYPGKCPLSLSLLLEDGCRVNLSSQIGVEVNPELKTRVKDLLGDNAMQLRPKTNRNRNTQPRNGKRRPSPANAS